MGIQSTVLVAEDDPVFRQVIAFSLRAAGFECKTVSNGSEAMTVIDQGGIDFLVTDHQMPICSGIELIERIRNRPDLKGLPIVLCTAKAYELDAESLVESCQVFAVLKKPFSPKELVDIISVALPY